MADRNQGSFRHTMRHYPLWLCAACMALAGCVAPPAPKVQDAVTAAPEPGRALVIGWGNTAGENARAALTPEQGSRVSRLFVSTIDGQRVSFGENIARIPPGEHALGISCGIYVDYRLFADDKLIRATVNANRVYRLRSDLEGRRCEPYLEDVTGKGG